MRKTLAAGFVAGLMAIAAPALAATPPSEGTTNNTPNNNVSCNGNVVYGLPDGSSTPSSSGTLMICNDGTTAPPPAIQGRIILSGSATSGGYIAADGDRDNPGQAAGYARLSAGTGGVAIHCGDTAHNDTDSTSGAAATDNAQTQCDPTKS